MGWRPIARWIPPALFLAFFGAGAGLLTVDLGASGAVLIIGAASGSQIGIVMILVLRAGVLTTRTG